MLDFVEKPSKYIGSKANAAIYILSKEFIDEFNWEDLGFNVNEGPFTLGPQEYWVVGDNRDVSWWGIIYEDDIIGKVK